MSIPSTTLRAGVPGFGQWSDRPGAFPDTELAARSILSLPLLPAIAPDHVGIGAEAWRVVLVA